MQPTHAYISEGPSAFWSTGCCTPSSEKVSKLVSNGKRIIVFTRGSLTTYMIIKKISKH